MASYDKILRSASFRKWLVSAESPLEFARGTVRESGDLMRRSTAANMRDRLVVADNFLTGIRLLGIKRKRDAALYERKRARHHDYNHEEDDEDDEDGGGHRDEWLMAVANHFFSRAAAELSVGLVVRPRGRYAVHPLSFENSINHYDDELCHKYFGLTQGELRRLFVAWGVPEEGFTAGEAGYRWTAEAAFLMYMRYMCDTIDINDPAVKKEMGFRSTSSMSVIIVDFDKWLFTKFKWLYTGSMDRWAPELKRWRNLIREQAGQYRYSKFGWVCMFLDGTFTRTCRPGGWAYLQRVLYTRHKKTHGVGCQGVVAPNGLFVSWWGPAPGRHNDNWMLNHSNLRAHLRSLFDLYPGTPAQCRLLKVYGDLIYAESQEISRGYRKNAAATPAVADAQKRANGKLNGPRTSVEHGFKKIQRCCKRICVKTSMKVMGSKKLQATLANCMFIANCHTCLRGSQINTYFASSPPTLEEYVVGGTTPAFINF